MPSLTIVTPAYFDNLEPCQRLMESCLRLGLHLHLYGMGEPWPGLYQAKVVQLRREIEKLESEYILVSDSSDVFFLAGADEILEKFHAAHVGVLVSGEKNCWPQPALAEYYSYFPNTPWRYVNSGGYLGIKQCVLALIAEMASLDRANLPLRSDRDLQNDQFLMSVSYLKHLDLFSTALDESCQIFQTMHSSGPELEWQEGRLVNKLTASKPCHVHFNGNWPGIAEAFERRFSPCNEPVTTA